MGRGSGSFVSVMEESTARAGPPPSEGYASVLLSAAAVHVVMDIAVPRSRRSGPIFKSLSRILAARYSERRPCVRVGIDGDVHGILTKDHIAMTRHAGEEHGVDSRSQAGHRQCSRTLFP